MREKLDALGEFIQECNAALKHKQDLEEMISMMGRGFDTGLQVFRHYVELVSPETRAAAIDLLERMLDEATARANRLEKELDK